MIKRLYIDNFKSLSEFHFPIKTEDALPKFVCMVGQNGAGKSTVIQALDFLSHLAAGDVAEWLRVREWSAGDLRTKKSGKSLIRFSVDISSYFGDITWSGAYNIFDDRCSSERLDFFLKPGISNPFFSESSAIVFDSGYVRLSDGSKNPLLTEYKGSAILGLTSGSVPQADWLLTTLVKYYLSGVKSLELLSPDKMRKPSREAVDIGYGGEKLATFVKGLSREEKDSLFASLSDFYPDLKKVYTKSSQYGWNRLFFSESGVGDSEIEIEARHVNDGLLRLAAIVAQTVAIGGITKKIKARDLPSGSRDELGNIEQKKYQYILLEEIENGINPELIEKLVKYLCNVEQQVFITTHSPLILNYLSDEDAKKSVFLIYRSKGYKVIARRLFEVANMGDKLNFMGPGEAYADTPIESLAGEMLLVDNA